MKNLILFVFVCSIVLFTNFAQADMVDFRHKVFTFNANWGSVDLVPPSGGKMDYRYRFELFGDRLGLEWTIFSLGGDYHRVNNDHLGFVTLDMKLGPTFAFCNYFEIYAGVGPQGYLYGGYRSEKTEDQNGYVFGSWGVAVDAGARLTLGWFFLSASYVPHIPIGGEPGELSSAVVIQDSVDNEKISSLKGIDNNFGNVEKVKGTWHNRYAISLGFIW